MYTIIPLPIGFSGVLAVIIIICGQSLTSIAGNFHYESPSLTIFH